MAARKHPQRAGQQRLDSAEARARNLEMPEMLDKLCLVARELELSYTACGAGVGIGSPCLVRLLDDALSVEGSAAAVMQCAPREEKFELVWSANRISARLGQTECRRPAADARLQFAAISCRLQRSLQAHRGCARHRELDVVRPRLLKSSTSAPPLALVRFHYPRAYLTTSVRPHTALDSLDSYQTLSNPQTNAIAARPGAAAVSPSARLADTEPPAAS